MSRSLLCLFLSASLAYPLPTLAQTTSADLARGIRQVEEGDLSAAIITLDGVIQRAGGAGDRNAELALAHLYLGIAHLGVSQEERAKAEMREAWRNNKGMKLDPKKFPPRVIQAYEEAKTDAAAGQKSADSSQAPARDPKKGGGGSKAVLILGGVAAAGGGIALAGGGSSSGGPTAAPLATPAPTPQPTPTPTPTPAPMCTITVATSPDAPAPAGVGGRYCTVSVTSGGVPIATVSGVGTFSLACTTQVTFTATAANQSPTSGPLPATWTEDCSGSALGNPCSFPVILTSKKVGLICQTR